MINKLKDLIDNEGIGRIIVPILILLLLLVGITIDSCYRKSDSNKTTSTNEPVATEESTVPVESAEPAEAYSNENTPATPESTESVVVEPTAEVTPTASQTIANYLIATGDYNNFPSSEDSWRVEDLSSYVDQDGNFANLYIYRGYGHYKHEMDGHASGGEVMFTCYVTKLTDGNTVIHYIARDGEVLVNDGFVTDSMMRIMNGDSEE